MSEEQELYLVGDQKDKLLWMAKRLKDVSKDISQLSQEDRKFVIERVDQQEAWALKELFESLNEYMGW